MKKKIVYYHPIPNAVCDIGNLNIPIKKNSDLSLKKTNVGKCPAWNHQNSRTFTYYSSSYFHLDYDQNAKINYSNSLTQQELNNSVDMVNNIDEEIFVYELRYIFANFYWTDHKGIWISILPHPLTALNNNFYHCGAWFNLSNWPRYVNIGAVVVDKNKPIIINRGDPLYTIKFHTENQNESIDLVKKEIDEKQFNTSLNKLKFVRTNHASGFDYEKILFEESKKSKCPFNFLWK